MVGSLSSYSDICVQYVHVNDRNDDRQISRYILKKVKNVSNFIVVCVHASKYMYISEKIL